MKKKFKDIVSKNKVSGFEEKSRKDIANREQLDKEFEEKLKELEKRINHIPKVYFAHPINTYNTIIEQIAINKIKALGKCEIINPNNPAHQEGYYKSGMEYFKNLVQQCDYCYVLPFHDGSIGAGIDKEIKWAFEKNIKCILLNLTFNHHEIFSETYTSKNYNILTVEETREKLKKSKPLGGELADLLDKTFKKQLKDKPYDI